MKVRDIRRENKESGQSDKAKYPVHSEAGPRFNFTKCIQVQGMVFIGVLVFILLSDITRYFFDGGLKIQSSICEDSLAESKSHTEQKLPHIQDLILIMEALLNKNGFISVWRLIALYHICIKLITFLVFSMPSNLIYYLQIKHLWDENAILSEMKLITSNACFSYQAINFWLFLANVYPFYLINYSYSRDCFELVDSDAYQCYIFLCLMMLMMRDTFITFGTIYKLSLGNNTDQLKLRLCYRLIVKDNSLMRTEFQNGVLFYNSIYFNIQEYTDFYLIISTLVGAHIKIWKSEECPLFDKHARDEFSDVDVIDQFLQTIRINVK